MGRGDMREWGGSLKYTVLALTSNIWDDSEA